MFMKKLAVLLCCLTPFAACAQADSEAAVAAKPRIEAVVESFRTAITDRDTDRFTRLFLHEQATWQAVMSDHGLERLRKDNSEARKVRVNPERTYRSFIEGIAASERRSEETFENVRIDTDGDIASVYFDYAFISDGRRTNYGKEAWHLVNTDQGWKIVSVIWSINPVPVPETRH
jgi:hypothetical protein